MRMFAWMFMKKSQKYPLFTSIVRDIPERVVAHERDVEDRIALDQLKDVHHIQVEHNEKKLRSNKNKVTEIKFLDMLYFTATLM